MITRDMEDQIAKHMATGWAEYSPSCKLGKLTYKQVRLIRGAKGLATATDVAKQYGVKSATILSVWRGETWKDFV